MGHRKAKKTADSCLRQAGLTRPRPGRFGMTWSVAERSSNGQRVEARSSGKPHRSPHDGLRCAQDDTFEDSSFKLLLHSLIVIWGFELHYTRGFKVAINSRVRDPDNKSLANRTSILRGLMKTLRQSVIRIRKANAFHAEPFHV